MNDADVALDFVAPHQTFGGAAVASAAEVVASNVVVAPTDLIGGDDAVAVDAVTGGAGAEVVAKGRMADAEVQIFSETVRRLSRSRGGVFEMLSLTPGQQPGDAAQSLEGWVLIITGLPEECTEGDILDYFGRRAEVKQCRMNYDRRTSRCCGHAFVEYATREEAELVVSDMNGQAFLSSDAIAVSPAFLVPELAAFEQLGGRKRGRAGNDRLGADDVEGDACIDGDDRGGVRAE